MAKKKAALECKQRIYLASRAEIDAACAKIQETWSEREQRKRSGLVKDKGWTPPVVSVHWLVDDDGMSVEIEEG